MRRAAVLLVLALVAWSAPAAAISWEPSRAAVDYRSSISNWVRWFHKATRVDRLVAALELVDPVVDVALAHRVNPAIVAAVVTLESSWKPDALGKIGERGLMQVARAPGDTPPREQLERGVEILVACHDRCGTVAGALSCYATGRGCRVYRGAALRIRLAERIEKEF